MGWTSAAIKFDNSKTRSHTHHIQHQNVACRHLATIGHGGNCATTPNGPAFRRELGFAIVQLAHATSPLPLPSRLHKALRSLKGTWLPGGWPERRTAMEEWNGATFATEAVRFIKIDFFPGREGV